MLAISCGHLSEGGTPARVVDDPLHAAPDVPIALRVVQTAELGLPLPVLRVGLEDPTAALTLCPDNASHLQII